MQPDLIKKFEEENNVKFNCDDNGALNRLVEHAEALGYARCEKVLREIIDSQKEVYKDVKKAGQEKDHSDSCCNETLDTILSLFPKQDV